VPSFTSAAHPTQANDSDDVTSNPRANVPHKKNRKSPQRQSGDDEVWIE
jgi:hypothetical protein